MRRLGLALAIGVLAAGTSAVAQVTVDTNATTASTTVNYQPFDPVPVTFLIGGSQTNGSGNGATFDSFVHINPNTITFESLNTSAVGSNLGNNNYVSTISSSTVQLDLHNAAATDVTFKSTITPAGLGFYLADTSTGCLYTGCAPIPTASAYTFNDLGMGFDSNLRAEVGFSFDVSRLGDTGPSLFHLEGSLSLLPNVDGTIVPVDQLGNSGSCNFDFCPSASGPRGILDQFHLATPADSQSNLGYTWGAHDISFGLGDAVDQTLVYTTSVFSLTGSNCIVDTQICLVAYSGFGDPVGRGGGIDSNLRSLTSFSQLGGPGGFGSGQSGLQFAPTTFQTPTFQNGVLSFEIAPNAGVPEPTTWMTLILGFGLLGVTLRRRRTIAAI